MKTFNLYRARETNNIPRAPMKTMNTQIAVIYALLIGFPTMLLAMDTGEEFKAKIVVTAENPLVATVTIAPTISLTGVIVEIPNDRSGSKTVCWLGDVSAGRSYSCNLTGSADELTNGLVVSIVGAVITKGDEQRIIIRKAFTIPNPSYNAARARAIEIEEQKKSGRLQQRSPSTK